MLHVSESATAVLFNRLVDASVPAGEGYRLVSTGAGYTLRPDQPAENDRVVSRMNHVVLMVEQGLDEQLNGVVLDLKDAETGRLTLRTQSEPES